MEKYSASYEKIEINNDYIKKLYSTFDTFKNYYSEKEIVEIYDYIKR